MTRMNEQSEHSYPVRTANIGSICMISVSQAGCVQIGDRAVTNAKQIGVALQRQEDHPGAGDVFFEMYPLFYRPLPYFDDPGDDNGQVVSLHRTNCAPNITVGHIQVIAAGAASSIQAGNGMCLTGESRIKNVRQYPRPKPYPPIGC
ncbi:MAG TPA: spore germination protein GerPE [Candidatus Udaeobacter sp.]|nr:spore germination protein GerPE [Candidatus Udaeobacter sp.]